MERISYYLMKGSENDGYYLKPRISNEQARERIGLIEDILGDDYDLSRLRDLVQADREGRCVVLPCKIGETLWCINNYGEIEETVAVGFLIEKESIYIYYREKMSSEYYNAPIGKVLFPTCEAAEEALKGEKHG